MLVRAPDARSRRAHWLAACITACAMALGSGFVEADEPSPGVALEFPVRQGGETNDSDLPVLWARQDPKLQLQLEVAMAGLGLAAALGRGSLGVALVDITQRRRPRVAAVNGDKMFYAASLPKIAVLLAVFEKAEAGELEIDAETHQQLYKMIRISSNSDSTALMQKVGKQYIADVLRAPRYRLYDVTRNGGLWAGKDYASEGLWRRDPVHNLSHGATAMQIVRFFYLLEMGQLVSPRASLEMKEILRRDGTGQKFLKGFRQVRPNAKIHRKGGTWRNHHADGALVERTDGATYLAAALAESEDGREWLTQIAIAMDGLIDAPPRPQVSRGER
jgi:beta-lactamase class A